MKLTLNLREWFVQRLLASAARDKAYAVTSNLCDQFISAFGRTSERAQESVNPRKKQRPIRSATTAASQPQRPKLLKWLIFRIKSQF
jgi:hypothetical protein